MRKSDNGSKISKKDMASTIDKEGFLALNQTLPKIDVDSLDPNVMKE